MSLRPEFDAAALIPVLEVLRPLAEAHAAAETRGLPIAGSDLYKQFTRSHLEVLLSIAQSRTEGVRGVTLMDAARHVAQNHRLQPA